MSRRHPNLCLDRSVSRDLFPQPVYATRAEDLTDLHVTLLVTTAVKQGGLPADKCMSLFRFEPDESGRALIGKVVDRICRDRRMLQEAWLILGWQSWKGVPMPAGRPTEWWP